MPNEVRQKNGIGGKVVIGVCLATIVVLLAVVVVLLTGREEVKEDDMPKRNVVVKEENIEEVIQDMVDEGQEYVEPGYFTACMCTEWYFENSKATSSNARVDNLLENTHDVYFDVFLADNEDEPIYCSPVIPRGAFLEHIALDKELDSGTHDCVMVYHLVDEEQNTISTLRIAFTITIDE